MKLLLSKKTAITSVILLAVLLNLSIFYLAYPQTFKPESATLARDFSAYYIGEWRLFHNPTQIYNAGVQPGDYQILAQPQPFKYTPSFLILFAPFLTLNYQNALNAFDIMQFLSILALAFFVYKLVKDKNLFLASIVAVIVLVDPLLFSPSASYSAAESSPFPYDKLACPDFLAKLLLRICLSKCPHPPNSPSSRRFVFWVRQKTMAVSVVVHVRLIRPTGRTSCIATATVVQ